MGRYPTSVTMTLKQRFPKFSKIQLAMVNNPEYGVDISLEAKNWLNHAKNGTHGADMISQLSPEEKELVNSYMDTHWNEIQEYIIWRATASEEPVHRLQEPEEEL